MPEDLVHGADNWYATTWGDVPGGDGMIVRWDFNDPENGELIARTESSVYAIKYIPDRDLLLVDQRDPIPAIAKVVAVAMRVKSPTVMARAAAAPAHSSAMYRARGSSGYQLVYGS